MKKKKVNIDELFNKINHSEINNEIEEVDKKAIFNNLLDLNSRIPFEGNKGFFRAIRDKLWVIIESKKIRYYAYGLAGSLAVIVVFILFMQKPSSNEFQLSSENNEITSDNNNTENLAADNSASNNIEESDYGTISLDYQSRSISNEENYIERSYQKQLNQDSNNAGGSQERNLSRSKIAKQIPNNKFHKNNEISEIAYNCIINELNNAYMKIDPPGVNNTLETAWFLADGKLMKISFQEDKENKLIQIKTLTKNIDNDTLHAINWDYKKVISRIETEIRNKIKLLN